MSLSAILEVVLGLAFLFAMLSLVASGINELVSSVLRLRAKTLQQGVANLLDDPSDAVRLYQHPLIQALYRGGRLPSYIPRDKFALALLDQKVQPVIGASTPDQLERAGSAIQELPDGQMKQTLDVLWRDAHQDITRFRRNVETWFDDGMERVSGWYRRLTQLILVVVGLALAVGLNVNALTVTSRLWSSGPLRAAVVEQAQRAIPPPADDGRAVEQALDNVQAGLKTIGGLSLPIGWGKEARPTWSAWHVALFGWLFTALAISMGAPFWFDLLGRVARLRSSGVRPQTALPPSAEAEPVQSTPAGSR